MNPLLSHLQPYPFEKLNELMQGLTAPAQLKHLSLSIGEPQHPAPEFIQQEITASLYGLSKYPTTKGDIALRQAIASWLTTRFSLPKGTVSADQNVLPVNGTREALFAFAQCVVRPAQEALVVMPNPFYQIYEGAAILAGARPYLVNIDDQTGLPDYDTVPEKVWKHCQLLYLCTPGNPTGAVASLEELKALVALSQKYNFVIASDECYSEIYANEDDPPPGLLQAAVSAGVDNFGNCLVFHSLSKRSSLPGMRSGFVAGDAAILKNFLLYRTYHGCAMSPPYQAASLKAWSDEEHVRENRRLYRQKFDAVLPVLQPHMSVTRPAGSFYVWLQTPVPGEEFARELFRLHNLTVLPGAYLSRDTEAGNPGRNRVRIALVPPLEDCMEAAHRLCECYLRLQGAII